MEKIALVIAIMKYYDTVLDRLVMRTEEHIVSLDRCKELISKNVCELIEISCQQVDQKILNHQKN